MNAHNEPTARLIFLYITSIGNLSTFAGLKRIDWNTIERTILKWKGVFETHNISV